MLQEIKYSQQDLVVLKGQPKKQAGTHSTGTEGTVLYINPQLLQADPPSVFLGEIHKDMNSCF